MTFSGQIKRTRTKPSGGRAPSAWYPKALMYSMGVHGLLTATVAIVAEVEWSSPAGDPNVTPEIAMVSGSNFRPLTRSRDQDPEIEVPSVSEVVEVIEEAPLVIPPEPLQPEPLDPLLEEEPFDEVELEPLSPPKVEEVEEEPVGEASDPVRELLESPLAVYPESAVIRRLEGTVLLSLMVDHAGVVVEVELVESSGHGSLDRAAIKAARAYRFEPGEGNLTVSKTFTFQLR